MENNGRSDKKYNKKAGDDQADSETEYKKIYNTNGRYGIIS